MQDFLFRHSRYSLYGSLLVLKIVPQRVYRQVKVCLESDFEQNQDYWFCHLARVSVSRTFCLALMIAQANLDLLDRTFSSSMSSSSYLTEFFTQRIRFLTSQPIFHALQCNMLHHTLLDQLIWQEKKNGQDPRFPEVSQQYYGWFQSYCISICDHVFTLECFYQSWPNSLSNNLVKFCCLQHLIEKMQLKQRNLVSSLRT